MATLPANCDWEQPTIGFVAHMDTAPDLTGENISPRIVQYEGGDIVLDAKLISASATFFPELETLYKGQEIIVTNGHTTPRCRR